MQHHGLPIHLFTLDPSDPTSEARVQVDVGQTGFWDGREFRISYPLSIPTTSQVVLKFVSPIDFILQLQELSSDVQGIKFEAYRSAQGTEGGTFTDMDDIFLNNFQSTAPVYTRQVTIATGGTFTPTGGEASVETIRVRVGTATAFQTTVGGTAKGERGLAAGTYYLVFTNITGTGTAEGVYSLTWEERPADLADWLTK